MMELFNGSTARVEFVQNAEDDNRMTYLFVAACTYDVRVDGRLSPAQQQLPVISSNDPPFVGDCVLSRRGASVCATGFAYAPADRATQGAVTLVVGDRALDIAVFGPRVWQLGARGEVVPSPAVRFERVEMDWSNAFGGMDEREARLVKMGDEQAYVPPHLVGFPSNFIGKGFFEDPKRAVGAPLPQLEHPHQLLRALTDRPEPVCLSPYPMWGALRAGYVVEAGRVLPENIDRLTNRGAPRNTFDRLQPGTRVALRGMRPGGEWIAFDVPAPPVELSLALDARRVALIPHVDSIDIDAEARRVRVVYRAMTTQPYIPKQVRVARANPVGEAQHGEQLS